MFVVGDCWEDACLTLLKLVDSFRLKKAKGINPYGAVCKPKTSVLAQSSQGVSAYHSHRGGAWPSSPSDPFCSGLTGSNVLEFRAGIPENIPGQIY